MVSVCVCVEKLEQHILARHNFQCDAEGCNQQFTKLQALKEHRRRCHIRWDRELNRLGVSNFMSFYIYYLLCSSLSKPMQ